MGAIEFYSTMSSPSRKGRDGSPELPQLCPLDPSLQLPPLFSQTLMTEALCSTLEFWSRMDFLGSSCPSLWLWARLGCSDCYAFSQQRPCCVRLNSELPGRTSEGVPLLLSAAASQLPSCEERTFLLECPVTATQELWEQINPARSPAALCSDCSLLVCHSVNHVPEANDSCIDQESHTSDSELLPHQKVALSTVCSVGHTQPSQIVEPSML